MPEAWIICTTCKEVFSNRRIVIRSLNFFCSEKCAEDYSQMHDAE